MKYFTPSIAKSIVYITTFLSFKKNEVHTLKSIQKKSYKKENFGVNHEDLLCKNLKHLEFIAFLEMNYATKKKRGLSPNLMESIHQTKTQAQINILNLLSTKTA